MPTANIPLLITYMYVCVIILKCWSSAHKKQGCTEFPTRFPLFVNVENGLRKVF